MPPLNPQTFIAVLDPRHECDGFERRDQVTNGRGIRTDCRFATTSRPEGSLEAPRSAHRFDSAGSPVRRPENDGDLLRSEVSPLFANRRMSVSPEGISLKDMTPLRTLPLQAAAPGGGVATTPSTIGWAIPDIR